MWLHAFFQKGYHFTVVLHRFPKAAMVTKAAMVPIAALVAKAAMVPKATMVSTAAMVPKAAIVP